MSSIFEAPRVRSILKRFHRATVIDVEHYGEVFNVKQQDFRVQKQRPALILAAKQSQGPADPIGFWRWRGRELLFFALAQLYLRLSVLPQGVSVGELCPICEL